MEFVVAVLSAAVSSAVPMLGSVIHKLGGKVKTDATSIKDELLMIQDTIRLFSPSQSGWINAPLKRLSYEIEDCIDCFQVKRTSSEEFAEEIARLKTRCEDTCKRLLDYIEIRRGLPEAAPAAAFVPHELQELLLGKQSDRHDNLNCLLYFCMFPHDHHARRNPLIRRWLAERLVRGEDDAVKYLKTLIDGKIINTTAKSNNGMMKRCQPPDEILNFIYTLKLRVKGALTSLKLHAELSKLSILKYLKLVEDNLGRVEILPEHLRSLERICIVCEPNLDITIRAGALPGLVSLHLICQDLDVLPGTPRMEIRHMENLQEVGLHSQVDQAIKQGWENAAEAHPNNPNVGTAILR